jgi:hypothetical protein
LPHFVCVCVGEIISLPWFSKELKMTYRRTTDFVASSLYFSFTNQYSLGGGFPFPIVLMSRYKLFLCHTLIKPDILGFLIIGVFAWVMWARYHEIRISMSLSELFQMVAIVEKIATNLVKTSKTILSISTMRCESKSLFWD